MSETQPTPPPAPEPLTIEPRGEPGPWRFAYGHMCGDVDRPSAGIVLPYSRDPSRRVGCALRREDVTALREFLQKCEARFPFDQKTFKEMLAEDAKQLAPTNPPEGDTDS